MPVLDTYRKQAKLLVRWHREGDYSIGGRVRQLERYRSLTDRDALALKFTLALAQEIVAVEAGHGSWAELKASAAGARKSPRSPLGPPLLKKVIPVLFVRDVNASAGFYQRKLGFTVDFLHGAPPFYGGLSRDGVHLHLRLVRRLFFSEAAAEEKSLILASVQVANVQSLFEEFQARGVKFPQKLRKQAWGGTDFQVRDPDGNVISFVAYDALELE
jgi:uncharacterized glyoxalase superfamily protein PhnB